MTLLAIISFIAALSLLILVHEFGHFWVARRAGVFVERFSIGFGPKLFSFFQGGTEFCISLLPLGGYVKLKGEDPDDVEAAKDSDAFPPKSVG